MHADGSASDGELTRRVVLDAAIVPRLHVPQAVIPEGRGKRQYGQYLGVVCSLACSLVPFRTDQLENQDRLGSVSWGRLKYVQHTKLPFGKVFLGVSASLHVTDQV